MKLTRFSKFLRMLRMDKHEQLHIMATKLEVTPGFLSSVEKGTETIPRKWSYDISKIYTLDTDQRIKLANIINENDDILRN